MAAKGTPSADRDLRTGTPLWLARGEAKRPPRMPPDGLRVDVAVVGGGVSGALVTDALLLAGLSVGVFDRRGMVVGSTPASTALLQFELDQPLTLLAGKVGRAKAARAWWRSAQAVGALQGRIADLGIKCGFRERHTTYLPGDVLDFSGLKDEAAARQKIGLRSRMMFRDELRRLANVDKPGAIWSAGNAELDPVRLVRGLWRSAEARGAQLFAPVDVLDMDQGRDGVTLTTDAGARIRARHVVLATGFELAPFLRPKGYSVSSTWALATRPQPENLWPSCCLIWQAADPYLYLRTTPDGRVIAGGEDEEFSDEASRDRLIPAKIAAIRRKLSRLTPALDTTPDFAWAGCFGNSETGMPAIGPVPDRKRCFAVLGFGGNGITFSAIAAQLVSRAILGIPDPDANLFALDTKR
jgi:glycine/D-amino acid oxidase-like deaminating enzyme